MSICKYKLIKFLILTQISLSSAQNPTSDPTNTGGWIPYAPLTDEFNGTSLDTTKWNLGSNSWNGRQPVFHTGDNTLVENGELILIAKSDPGIAPGYDYSSGYITSKDIRRYGYFEARIKAADNLLVSTFWMIGGNRTWNREIDILEVGAGAPGRESQVTSNFHTAATTTAAGVNGVDTPRPFHDDVGFILTEDFHIYGLEWDKDYCRFYVDGQLIRTADTLDFKVGIGMLLGMEFNAFFAGKQGDEIVLEDIERGGAPTTQRVDYVRAWIKPPTSQRYYVDAINGSNSDDGLSWATAKQSIGGAVNESYDGDTIWVAGGNYVEHLTVSGLKNLTISGGYFPGTTNRDPEGNPSVITAIHGYDALNIQGLEGVIIDGLDFTGTTVPFTSGVAATGPILSATLRNCVIRGNAPLNGAGAGLFIDANRDDIALQIEECLFTENLSLGAFAAGGAISGRENFSATIDRCEFRANESLRGGAIFLGGTPTASYKITNCVFSNNTSEADAGTVEATRGIINIINSTFYNNSHHSLKLLNNVNFSDSKVANTIFSNSGSAGIQLIGSPSPPAEFLSHNLFWQNSTELADGSSYNTAEEINTLSYADNNLINTPNFVDPINENFALLPSSIARNKGLTRLSSDTDFLSIPRPQSGRVDLGAFEFLTDRDHDGIEDEWETLHGLNFSLASDATTDLDGDGWTALQEFAFNTDPNEVDIFPRIQVSNSSNIDTHEVRFMTSMGREYIIQESSLLTPGSWTEVMRMIGDGNEFTLEESSLTPERFYRVGAQLPQ